MSWPPPAPAPPPSTPWAAPVTPEPQAPTAPTAIRPGAEYPQMLGGHSPASRWWRPLVAALIAVVGGVLANIVLSIVFVAAGAAAGVSPGDLLDPGSLFGFAFLTVSLVALIPTTLLGIGVAWGIRPTRALSVVGRLRWRWLLTCLAVLTPLWVVAMTISALIDGEPPAPEPHWWAFAVLVVLLIPLQATAEELTFRVLPILGIGAWLARWRWLALIVPVPVSTAVFVALHGSADPWIVLDLATFAVVAALLTWWTGGIEAAIALHVVNNVVLMLVTLVVGGFAQSFVSGESVGSPLGTLFSMLLELVAGGLLAWLAHRRGLARRTPGPAA